MTSEQRAAIEKAWKQVGVRADAVGSAAEQAKNASLSRRDPVEIKRRFDVYDAAVKDHAEAIEKVAEAMRTAGVDI